MSAPIGNKFAAKGDRAATAWLQVRVTTREKARFVLAANGRALSEWILEQLRAAARGANIADESAEKRE